MNDNPELFSESSPVPSVDQAPATMFTREVMEEIQAMLGGAVDKAEEAMEKIRAIAGPQPGKVPQDMIIKINQGTGFLRECRDTIGRLFREWEKTVRQQTCQHDRGLNHTARHSYCKLCEMEMVRNRGTGEYEPLGAVEP